MWLILLLAICCLSEAQLKSDVLAGVAQLRDFLNEVTGVPEEVIFAYQRLLNKAPAETREITRIVSNHKGEIENMYNAIIGYGSLRGPAKTLVDKVFKMDLRDPYAKANMLREFKQLSRRDCRALAKAFPRLENTGLWSMHGKQLHKECGAYHKGWEGFPESWSIPEKWKLPESWSIPEKWKLPESWSIPDFTNH
ncbi:unnamed protein product [Nippostrongylus brasiliensis]|uniref:Uncharacterized protein n=1 Tax=Nippostrongylus brasiliensis TaxID=27835 RepID=A0A0N4XCP8_NIPBR|nr:unnamed protein product [Nippostrongylus brasiliensis]